MPKSTKVEKDQRVNKVARMLSNGVVRSEICHYAAIEWGTSERQTDRYIADARKLIKADWEIDRKTFTAEILSQLSSIQKEARKTGNLNVALGCVNQAARIAHIIER